MAPRHRSAARAGAWSFVSLTPPGPEGLARGLAEGLDRPERSRERVDEGRACVARDHSVQPFVERMQRLYVSR